VLDFNGSTRQAMAGNNQAFYWVLAGVILAHAFLVFSPWFRADQPEAPAYELTQIQLITAPRQVESLEPASLAAAVPEVASAESVSQPVPAAEPPAPEPLPPPSPLSPSEIVRDDLGLRARILASPYLDEESMTANLFSMRTESKEKNAAFHFRDRPNMDSNLNPVPNQLPFANGPHFVVASYTPGLTGDVQRFFDTVTLEKEWVTKNGTRVKCAWVLILGGCGWD